MLFIRKLDNSVTFNLSCFYFVAVVSFRLMVAGLFSLQLFFPLSLSLSLSLAHTHTHTHTHSLSLSHTPTLSLTWWKWWCHRWQMEDKRHMPDYFRLAHQDISLYFVFSSTDVMRCRRFSLLFSFCRGTKEIRIEEFFAQTELFSKPVFTPGSAAKVNSILLWPWWRSRGQPPRFLLRQSKIESCWLLNLCEKTKINEKEAGIGPSFKKPYVFILNNFRLTPYRDVGPHFMRQIC